MKSTNYYNSFMEVAEDCPRQNAKVPPLKNERKTLAQLQYEMLKDHAYEKTSDDVLFGVFAAKNGISHADLGKEREKFFTRSQACLRCSPLTKSYGWGIHFDAEGKTALYAMESEAYSNLMKDENLQHLRAMRTRKKS